MPTSVAPASELPCQKSDCKTFLPTHRAAAPSSADDAERACISEAITVLCADWRRARALHAHQDQSMTRAAVDAPASHACSMCTLRALCGLQRSLEAFEGLSRPSEGLSRPLEGLLGITDLTLD